MTFEEWFTEHYSYQREYTVEYLIAQAAWSYQQSLIEKLEWDLADVRNALKNRIAVSDKTIADLTEKLEERQQKHLDSIRALRKANENIETLQAQLEVADIRPMGESEYLERIETLKDELEDKFRIICNLRSTIAGLTEKLDIERNNKGVNKLNDECLFDTQEEHDRYELEQAIMSCWGITDDLHLLADAMESGEHKRMHHEMLLNLSQLYQLKFEKLFKEFNKFTGCY